MRQICAAMAHLAPAAISPTSVSLKMIWRIFWTSSIAGARTPCRVLIGHSSGGGFALRVAALGLSSRFVGTILLAPYLGHDAPTVSFRERGWANVGMPR